MTERRRRVRFLRASAVAGSWLMLAALVWLTPSKGLCQDSVKTARTDARGKSFYVSLLINFGGGIFSGDPTNVFDREKVVGFGLGLRYRRLSLSTAVYFGSFEHLTSSYEASTQWESLELRQGSCPIDLGYQFAVSRRFIMEPFAGLSWVLVQNQNYSEPYINWDRSGLSKFWPTAGARCKFLMAGFRTTGQSNGYIVGEIRLSLLRYDNEDYGNGYVVHLLLGYGGDLVLF